MPIRKVHEGGKTGYRWGSKGHVYPTRAGAERQAAAAYAHGYKGAAVVRGLVAVATLDKTIGRGKVTGRGDNAETAALKRLGRGKYGTYPLVNKSLDSVALLAYGLTKARVRGYKAVVARLTKQKGWTKLSHRKWWDSIQGDAEVAKGDYEDCVQRIGNHVDDPNAFCAWAEHEGTGHWPAEKNADAGWDGDNDDWGDEWDEELDEAGHVSPEGVPQRQRRLDTVKPYHGFQDGKAMQAHRDAWGRPVSTPRFARTHGNVGTYATRPDKAARRDISVGQMLPKAVNAIDPPQPIEPRLVMKALQRLAKSA